MSASKSSGQAYGSCTGWTLRYEPPRPWCSGNTRAFQALVTGSSPVGRFIRRFRYAVVYRENGRGRTGEKASTRRGSFGEGTGRVASCLTLDDQSVGARYRPDIARLSASVGLRLVRATFFTQP